MQDSISSDNKNTLIELETSQTPPLGGRGPSYILHLADTTLILAQRNAEWCAHGPMLEQDIAITNISLDLIGQARNFYQYAALQINESTNPINQSHQPISSATEDSLAYLRTEREFKNLLLAELPNGDWAQTILRQYLFSQFQYLLFEKLQHDNDNQLAAIAAKAIKEVTYHVRWSSEWVIRLGDGTAESHSRMLKAIDELWAYTGEMFVPADYETATGIDFTLLKNKWQEKVYKVLEEATLGSPSTGGSWGEVVFMQTGGKQGIHTEHLGFILADLQYLQRTYPGAKW